MADDHCVLVKRYNSELSCCGILLDSENGIVLTVASLFADLLPQTEEQRLSSADWPTLNFQNDFVGKASFSGQIAVEVLIRKRSQEQFTTLQGCVVLLWRDKGLQRIAERIFPTSEWKFESDTHTNCDERKSNRLITGGNTNEQQQNEAFAHRNVLSDFALIRVENLKKYLSCKQLNLSTLRKGVCPRKGATVFVVGTPFGCECPPVFYNSVSKGIVSNLIGVNNELIITDARCVPGCEGCTLYIQNLQPGLTKRDSIPHGVILAPFCWRNGEWIGITVACSLLYLLQNLRKLFLEKFVVVPPNLQALSGVLNLEAELHCEPVVAEDKSLFVTHSNPCNLSAGHILQRAFASVVIVQVGRKWGSGIIVDADEGIVATCSHVIRTHEDCKMQGWVSCALPNGTCGMAQVLFAAQEDSPLDLALLKIQPHPSMRSLKPRLATDAAKMKSHDLSEHLYRKGEEVFVIGFPVFPRHQHSQPSVVLGVISNIAYVDNQAVLLQSSAAVHCGASGGAVVSKVTGELLGMVTSHTKEAHLLSSFPHVNYSIPAGLIHKVVSAVQSDRLEDGLPDLFSDQMESIWKLKSTVHQCPSLKSKL